MIDKKQEFELDRARNVDKRKEQFKVQVEEWKQRCPGSKEDGNSSLPREVSTISNVATQAKG